MAQRPSGPAAQRPSGPAAQRPSGPAAQRPSGPAAQRPSGPAAQRPSGPAAQRPSGPAAQRPSGPAAQRPSGPAAQRPSGMTCARRLAGARKPASPTPSASPRKPDARSGRSRARLSLLLPVLALLAGALGTFAAAPAQAQRTTIWSTTLTVDLVGNFAGCDNSASTWDNCSSALGDDDFSYDGTPLTVTAITVPASQFNSGTSIHVRFHAAIPAGLRTSDGELTVGSTTLAFSNGSYDPSDAKSVSWSGLSLGTWTDGQSVAMSISHIVTPPAPTGLTATAGGGKVTLSWTAPAANPAIPGGGHRYTVEYGKHPDGELTKVLLGRFRAAMPSYVVSGLEGGATYRFRVRTRGAASYGVPDGAWSAWATAAVLAPPGAPTGLTVTPGSNTLAVSWTAPSGTLTGYDVHYTSSLTIGANARPVGSNPALQWIPVSRTETAPPTASQTITSLTNNRVYRVRVRAKDARGESPGWRRAASRASAGRGTWRSCRATSGWTSPGGRRWPGRPPATTCTALRPRRRVRVRSPTTRRCTALITREPGHGAPNAPPPTRRPRRRSRAWPTARPTGCGCGRGTATATAPGCWARARRSRT